RPACARLLEQTRAGGQHISLAADETRRSSSNILLSSCDHIDLLVLRSLSGSSSGRTVGDDDALLSEVHLGSEGGVGHPFVGGARGGLLEHLIDLLEGEALSLRDEEVGEGEGDAAEGAPHKEHLGAEVGLSWLLANEVGGDDCDDLGEFVSFVRGGGETDTARADRQGEDLADDDLGARALGEGEEGDVDADEGDHSLDGGLVVLSQGAGSDANNADDKLCNDHAYSAKDKDAATAEALYNLEGRRGAKDVDKGGGEGDKEGVFNCAEGSEEDSSEVEDEVDTSKLLHHLEDYAKDRATDVRGALSNGAVEAVGLAAKEEETGCKDDGLQELHSNGDAVGSGVVAVLRSVDNTVGEEDSNSDAELVARHKGTIDLLRGDLRHVQDNDGRDESNTSTGD
ncbi:hypothetical protein V500_06350, partial [Pseudogymnoascus sp. VKM F-4518 (FW-2643)]